MLQRQRSLVYTRRHFGMILHEFNTDSATARESEMRQLLCILVVLLAAGTAGATNGEVPEPNGIIVIVIYNNADENDDGASNKGCWTCCDAQSNCKKCCITATKDSEIPEDTIIILNMENK